MYILKQVCYKNILNIEELNIKQHQVTTILGESGCGKTTLLRLLNKLITADSGELFYKGENINKADAIVLRRGAVMLPQNPEIFPGSVRDNMQIALKFSEKAAASDEEMINALHLVNLNKSLEESCQKFSGGERQRLSLARILLLDPDVFLLDEPTSALDDSNEELVIANIVQYIKESNKTLIMVTHSRSIATRHSDTVVLMDKGRVINKESKN